nr:redoxin domain-containing protein [Pseudopedobacter sp.]
MKKQFLIITLVLFQLDSFSQSKIDQKAENLEFSKILNYTNTTSFNLFDLKPKVVIIDFWATWCSPCLKSLEHLEDLQTKFKDDIQVISVTDETEKRINAFLNKRTMTLPIVLDEDGKLSKYFPHKIISHTIIIDQNGIIRAITDPESITVETISKLLRGEKISLPEKKENLDFNPSKPLSVNSNFIYQVVVTPFQNGIPSMSNTSGGEIYNGRRILATNLSLKSLYEIAFGFPASIKTRIEVKDKSPFEWKKENAICIDIILPENIGYQRFDIMKQLLKNMYGYKVEVKTQAEEVKVLRVIKNGKTKLNLTKGGTPSNSYGGNGLDMINSNTNVVAEFLENQFNKPVLNETNLSENYDLKLDWYNEDPKKIYESLKDLGLELMNEERNIEVLVISDK